MSLRINLHAIASAVLGILSLTMLVPASQAQFKMTDNFNRTDGVPGLGWSTWGNGAQISGNQLETFGDAYIAGGIVRTLDVTFPATFSYDFSTATPSDGGWSITFNASGANWLPTDAFELRVLQFSGSQPLCADYQTASGPMESCSKQKTGQRDYTAKAHIAGTINADFSTTVTVTYNDGLTPASIVLKTSAPAGAIQTPLGSVFYFGNANDSYGPHYFDNFSLTLK